MPAAKMSSGPRRGRETELPANDSSNSRSNPASRIGGVAIDASGCEQEQEKERIAESSRLFRAAPEHRDRLRLRQNSRRRIPLARKLRQSLLNFCPCPSLPYCRPLFSDHRFTSAQIAHLEQVRWSNAYGRGRQP